MRLNFFSFSHRVEWDPPIFSNKGNERNLLFLPLFQVSWGVVSSFAFLLSSRNVEIFFQERSWKNKKNPFVAFRNWGENPRVWEVLINKASKNSFSLVFSSSAINFSKRKKKRNCCSSDVSADDATYLSRWNWSKRIPLLRLRKDRF